MTTPKPPATVAIVAVCIVFCFTLACVVAVFVAAPEGSNTPTLVASLLATIPPTLAAVALLVQVKDVKNEQAAQAQRVERIAEDTYALTNGLLDSKVRAGVADVVKDEHLDPAALDTIAVDRALRDQRHGTPPEATP